MTLDEALYFKDHSKFVCMVKSGFNKDGSDKYTIEFKLSNEPWDTDLTDDFWFAKEMIEIKNHF